MFLAFFLSGHISHVLTMRDFRSAGYLGAAIRRRGHAFGGAPSCSCHLLPSSCRQHANVSQITKEQFRYASAQFDYR
jgi:hypothetical protein